ncbi:class II fructose-bisphosphate aldolase [Lachnotalea sp. AF33-28]|uniref:class II fructose-bisphosphate aldolase n=1 Tax=Lachnotalea sp. AF33-28 TaxID=2292046 RepID=UPI001314CE5F|nr:class II fructose-bisphosphate aldolase [Lachnotalea sp. AF33-28]
MLVNPKELLKDAQQNNYAIAGINATTLEGIQAVIEAAEEVGAPIMLSHAQVHDPYAPIDTFGPLLAAFAEKAKIPVVLHLDHGTQYSYILKAIRYGFNSIMYDCSNLPVEENIAKVKAFTESAHDLGIIIEAEVGMMPSNIVGMGGCTEYGKSIDNIEQYYTDPELAAYFCKETKIDMLAASFGTVHGFFVEKPVLDFERLKKIEEACGIPLVMHGTTGVDHVQIKRAIVEGVRKFNYFTGVATAAALPVEEKIKNTKGTIYYHEIAECAKEAMKIQAKNMLTLLRNT